MTGLYLAAITILIGALAVTLWGHDQQTIRANKAEGEADQAWQVADNALADLAAETRAHAVTKERLAIADLVNDTLVDDLRVAWGEPADDIDQAVQLANGPRHEAIVALIASNEAARFNADGADWGQP